ncbi:bifunctional [glutamate--ammonia ligase]-adenylyl-L-tyrosine phosphorylase/[glutamate--ammonia-ligase] adenylyltransferase [Endozoicomonas sp. Mp262]|uniref:bifunctional [glutamate--ammonia ligase]-adenylyl-L-tyrosine phosphorylase/[glutamate--ammonia-ligase] adenylyltransferase n=1 Tax=Endozoicomonas sp. Mp262 TaxID=2919499 RepID=UPI0021DB52E6
MEQALQVYWQQFLVACEAEVLLQKLDQLPAPFLDQLIRSWVASDFVAEQFIHQPALLFTFYQHYQSHPGLEVSDHYHSEQLSQLLTSVESESQLMSRLRHYRNREITRIIWRDSNQLANLKQITTDLSNLADACIDQAQQWLYNDLAGTFGTPHKKHNGKVSVPQKLVVLGMGKLGARELNLSSDIDLIFSYPSQGETTGGARSLTNQEFFIRLGQRLIKVLDSRTAEGFVFRVDMRLRPYGSSGALAMSFAAMEQYYQDQGRDWERYAMVKARAVAGDHGAGELLLSQLKPFVYRRYIDFSAISALRDMKRLIEREVKRKGMNKNIKLGPGGIREIEFIAQSFQLIHGGRDRSLQKKSLLEVLTALKTNGYLPEKVIGELRDAYIFLRDLEHALQAVKDKQTQTLPGDDKTQARVSWSMGCQSWPELSAALDRHRHHVISHFDHVISESAGGNPESEKTDLWSPFWLGQLTEEEELGLLTQKGFKAPKASHGRFLALREGKALSRVRRQSRGRLDKFMPILLDFMASSSEPDIAMNRLLPLVEAVLRRTVYLVLLMENPGALEHLCKLCIASPWIADQIAGHPSLLDEFLNLGLLYKAPEKHELADDLRQQLAHIPEDDLESQMEVLRYFKMAHTLRVTAAHVAGTLPLMKESDYLTWIAEVVLDQVVTIAWKNLIGRHGFPVDENNHHCDPGFIVIGYGKLGGIELGPGSDLDLVFVHNGAANKETDGPRKIDCATFYTRLGQRIIHILTTQTLSGALYEVDMRLRPSGSSGLLVSSFKAFEKYQLNDAWTWEHQALVRARVVAGDSKLAEQFEKVRAQVLSQQREPDALRQKVLDMRNKMREHLGSKGHSDLFDIKHDEGGIVDIEFLMQYAVLRYASSHPSLIQWTDNIRISEQLEHEKLLDETLAHAIRDAYQQLRLSMHKQALQNKNSIIPASEVEQYQKPVKDLWGQWIH